MNITIPQEKIMRLQLSPKAAEQLAANGQLLRNEAAARQLELAEKFKPKEPERELTRQERKELKRQARDIAVAADQRVREALDRVRARQYEVDSAVANASQISIDLQAQIDQITAVEVPRIDAQIAEAEQRLTDLRQQRSLFTGRALELGERAREHRGIVADPIGSVPDASELLVALRESDRAWSAVTKSFKKKRDAHLRASARKALGASAPVEVVTANEPDPAFAHERADDLEDDSDE